VGGDDALFAVVARERRRRDPIRTGEVGNGRRRMNIPSPPRVVLTRWDLVRYFGPIHERGMI
jgi:hypothetical protein